MAKQLLFSLSKKDFIVQTFRCGGKGGQNVNKVETGVRIKHPASGAVAEGTEHRTQIQNKKAAFERLVQREEFKKWHHIACCKALGNWTDPEAEVEKAMDWKNLKIEVQVDGRWVEVKPEDLTYEELDDE